MYAVFLDVTIKPGRRDDAVSVLREQTVPMVKGAPGFKKGIWIGDDTSGHAVMVFDSEESARAMASQVVVGPQDAIQIDSVKVFEVHAEA